MANIKTERQKRIEEAIRQAAEAKREHLDCPHQLFAKRFKRTERGNQTVYMAEAGDVKRCPHGSIFVFNSYAYYLTEVRAKELNRLLTPFRYHRAVIELEREEREASGAKS